MSLPESPWNTAYSYGGESKFERVVGSIALCALVALISPLLLGFTLASIWRDKLYVSKHALRKRTTSLVSSTN